MSDQDCCCSKGVLRTADVRAMILCVTCVVLKHHASWHWLQEGLNCAGLSLLLPLLHYYFTYWYHYLHYCRKRICESAWHSLKKRVQRHPPPQAISFCSIRKQIGINRQAPTCLAAPAGLLGLGRRPGRPVGCKKAIWRAWQGKTDRPIHQHFRQPPFCPATRDRQFQVLDGPVIIHIITNLLE